LEATAYGTPPAGTENDDHRENIMSETMRAVMKIRKGPGVEITETKIPIPLPGEVLIRTRAMSVCGTDVHIYHWDRWSEQRIEIPIVIGHEFSGDVVEIAGDTTRFKIGDLVTAETHISDGTCYQCRTGNAHICENVSILGVDRNGSYAEFVTVPIENVWPVPDHIPPEFASVMEPLGNAVHTAFSGRIEGATVLVTGCGPIGLFSIAVSRFGGASRIFATEVKPFRRELAKRMGADVTINPVEEDVADIVLGETGGIGADVLLEMSGHPDAIHQGLAALKKGGRASLLGIPAGKMEIDLAEELIFKEVEMKGINGRLMFDTWYQMNRLFESGRLDIEPVITHRMRLDQFDEAIRLIDSGETGKIVLRH
jgi:threonine 3-dehydrogenase